MVRFGTFVYLFTEIKFIFGNPNAMHHNKYDIRRPMSSSSVEVVVLLRL